MGDIPPGSEAEFATLEMIYEMLSEKLKACWRMLSVFSGDFDLTAVSVVLGFSKSSLPANFIPPARVQEIMTNLAGYDLLEVNRRTNRYWLHDLTRQYTLRRLEQDEEYSTRMRHAIYFLEVLCRVNDLIENPGTVSSGLALFDQEWQEIQSAFTWTADAERDQIERLSLCGQFLDAGRHVFVRRLSSSERATLRETGLRVAERASSSSDFYVNRGNECRRQGDFQGAIRNYELSLEFIRQFGDSLGEENVLALIGNTYKDSGQFRDARRTLEERLKLARRLGYPERLAKALIDVGLFYEELYRRNMEAPIYKESALNHYREALPLAQSVGNIQLVDWIQRRLDALMSM